MSKKYSSPVSEQVCGHLAPRSCWGWSAQAIEWCYEYVFLGINRPLDQAVFVQKKQAV